MSDERQSMEVFIDLRPNWSRNELTREDFKKELRQRFEALLPGAVERIWELPPITLEKPVGIYRDLLVEARDLFVDGYYYSCVAMCGIASERIIKDELRAAILIKKDGKTQSPEDAAFDQFEHVDVSSITHFLNKAEILSEDAAKAVDDLGRLRNSYVHARGKKPEVDAIKAIKLLHILVEGTVSVFKDFEIKDGALVRKATTPK